MALSRHNEKVGATMRQAILDSLASGPKTSREIAEEIGANWESVRNQVRELRTPRMKFIYVWKLIPRPLGGPGTPIYALGNKPDAIAPKNVRMVVEEDPEELMAREAARKARRIKPPPPDPLFAWIPRRQEIRHGA